MAIIQNKERDDESLVRDYRDELRTQTLKLGRIFALIGIPILVAFIFEDIAVLGTHSFIFWRLVQIAPCAIFLALSYTYLTKHRSLIIPFHALSLLGVIAGMSGMTVLTHSSTQFSSEQRYIFLNGLMVAMIATYIFAGGARRYLIYLLTIPMIFLIACFHYLPSLENYSSSLLSNPAVAAAAAIAMAFTQEKLIFREFRVKRLLRIKDWAVKTASNPMAFSDLNRMITYVNPAFLRLWGYDSPAEVLGKTAETFWNDDDKWAALRDGMSTDHQWTGELIARHKNGSNFEVMIFASTVLDDDDLPICMQASFIDLTDRKRAEREKRDLQAQLLHSEKLASIGTMAAGVAHEINNPLAIVSGFTDLLGGRLQAFDPKFADRTLTAIHNSINRIVSIVNGLRTYARSDTDHVEAIDINKVIIETIPLVQDIAKSNGIAIRQNLATGATHVRGNIGKIQQVLINLLNNARDALLERPTDRQVTIETIPDEENVTIILSDNGPGIPEAILGRILDPFFTTKEAGKGTGLGLSITSSIIKSFGGSLKVSSKQGEGATFHIRLQRMSPPATTEHTDNTYRREDPRLQVDVLVIDDEPALCQILKSHLEEAGATVTASEDPFAALEMMERKRFDLIITDMQMPALTGIDLIKKARKIECQADTKFIVLTGGITTSYSQEDRDFLLGAAHGYLSKPWEPETLVNLVGSLLPKMNQPMGS